jgi:general secretion pathway protein M
MKVEVIAKALEPAQAWWRSRLPRERQGMTVAVVLVLVYLAWAVGVQPALATLRRAPAELEALDLQWQQMQRLAAEGQTLRATPPVTLEQANAALKVATDRLGDKAKLSLQRDRAVLALTGVGTQQLRDWLGEARSGARARPVEASLMRGPQGYTGTLVMALGGNP